MLRLLPIVLALLLGVLLPGVLLAGPEEDRVAFSAYYEKRFPRVQREEHINGAYALDAGRRAQWLEMEEFPPYEFTIDDFATTENIGHGHGKESVKTPSGKLTNPVYRFSRHALR